jgi:membrane-bound lytic murein transglycosylase D
MITLLTAYLASGLVLLAGALAFAAAVRWGGRNLAAVADRYVGWGRAVLLASIVLPLLLIGGGVAPRGRPPLEIWSGPRISGGSAASDEVQVRLRLAGAAQAGRASLSLGQGALDLAVALLGLGVLAAGARRLRAQRRLQTLCSGLPVIKRVGQVVLAAGPESSGPFAARVGGRAYVVVPTSLLAHPRQLAMVLAHEAHHLRRGHLLAARLLAGVEALYFWNPALILWRWALGELEDLACDRQVLVRAGVSAREYGRCLLWAAGRSAPAAAHAMAASARHALQRRMTMLDQPDALTPTTSRARPTLLAAATATVILGAALAVHAAVGTPQVSASEVAAIGQRITARSGFPVIADARIAEALNRNLNQPAWREGMKAGLGRMPQHRAAIETALRDKGVPIELMAIVLSESRFDPAARTSRPAPRRSVGLWQLIPGTATRMGLTVTGERDDRLDPALSSAAAASYLASLHARYDDWPVAIAAYNAGEHLLDRFRNGVSLPETREKLLTSDAEFGRYLVSVMISMLVIEDPGLLD